MSKSNSTPYRLMSRYELREKYGGIPKDRPAPEINPNDVPAELRPLIPLAEKWGIVEDDWVPLDIIRKVPKEELEDLVETMSPYCTDRADDPFYRWLAGPEAEEPACTTAYLAFTELRIVFGNAEWDLKHWDEIHHPE